VKMNVVNATTTPENSTAQSENLSQPISDKTYTFQEIEKSKA